MPFGFNFKLLRRYREIIGILVKYGFQDMLSTAGFSSKTKLIESLLPSNLLQDIDKYSKWERIRLAVE